MGNVVYESVGTSQKPLFGIEGGTGSLLNPRKDFFCDMHCTYCMGEPAVFCARINEMAKAQLAHPAESLKLKSVKYLRFKFRHRNIAVERVTDYVSEAYG